MSNSPAGHVSWPDRFDDAPISSAQERRKHARKKLAFLTAVLVDSQSNTPATVVDLSEGGVGVRSSVALEQGTRCRLQLCAPDSDQVIDAACELAWNRAPHAGFRFSILTEKSQRLIKEWLTSREQFAEAELAAPGMEAHEPVPSATAQELDLALVSDERLLELALQVCKLPNTHGVAVAINDGEGVICRISLGCAPDAGVRLQPDRGLSGECLRTGEIVVCYDAENDPRVDPAIASVLNMRSAVILPIGRHETPAGLLEVFSGAPQAFDEPTVYALQELVTAFLIAGESTPTVQKDAPEEAQPEAASGEPVEEPRTGRSLPQMASFSQREAPPGFVICDVCGEENNENNRVCDKCDVPLPRALRYVDLNSPEESENSGFRAYPGRTEPPVSTRNGNHRKKVLLMLVVAALIVVWRVRDRVAGVDLALIPLPKMMVAAPSLQKAPAVKKSAPAKAEAKAKKPQQAQANSHKEDPTEPEVVLRTFPIQTKAPAKAADKKPAEKRSNGSTIPEVGQPADALVAVAPANSAE